MAETDSHHVVIERNGTAHRARCDCGWSGHPWNELRPAEADAWHHTFGDERVVDAGTEKTPQGASRTVHLPVNALVDKARALARSHSPHRPAVVSELTRAAGESNAALSEARDEIARLLRNHARASASTADEEWLELQTARRLVEAAQAQLEMMAEADY